MRSPPLRTATWLALLCALVHSGCDSRPPGSPGTVATVNSTTPMSSASTPKAIVARVELDIYSGRPNPTWSLNPSDANYLSDALSTASPLASTRNLSMPLGYRGVLVTIERENTTRVFRIVDGVIEASDARSETQLSDPNRSLERWLLRSAVPHIDAELYNSLMRQVP